MIKMMQRSFVVLSLVLLLAGSCEGAADLAAAKVHQKQKPQQERRPLKDEDHPWVLKNLPDTGEPWRSIPQTAERGGNKESNNQHNAPAMVEFQPAADLSPLAEQHLRRMTDSWWTSMTHQQQQETQDDSLEYQTASMFADTKDTYYDEYAQAWRALGFYIDCDADRQQQDDHRQRDRRQQEGENGAERNCQRYLLWAAYIDEGYSGHGVGEYMYYDRTTDQWSDYACYTAQNTERCVPMDCHLPDTHFRLLGYFKEADYDDWMEQLFKHEGICVWSEDEYEFMQNDRELWPTECTATDYTDSAGNTIYYHLKPGTSGSYDIGLYNDTACVEEYLESTYTRSEILGDQFGGGGGGGGGEDGDESNDLDQILETWNAAFDVFKQCQPCKAYLLTEIIAGMDYDREEDGSDNDNNDPNRRRRKLEDGDGSFSCNDDAGYTDVNQCMKFATKTNMMSATWSDVTLGGYQNSIAAYAFPGGNTTIANTYSIVSEPASTTTASSGGRMTKTGAMFFLQSVLLVFSAMLFLICFVRHGILSAEYPREERGWDDQVGDGVGQAAALLDNEEESLAAKRTKPFLSQQQGQKHAYLAGVPEQKLGRRTPVAAAAARTVIHSWKVAFLGKMGKTSRSTNRSLEDKNVGGNDSKNGDATLLDQQHQQEGEGEPQRAVRWS